MRQRRLDERVDAGRSAHRLYLSPPPLETQCICDALGMIHQRRERLAAIPAGATAPLSDPPGPCVRARSLYAAVAFPPRIREVLVVLEVDLHPSSAAATATCTRLCTPSVP